MHVYVDHHLCYGVDNKKNNKKKKNLANCDSR